MIPLTLVEIQEDFMEEGKTYIYQCENDECADDHDSKYYVKDGELHGGTP